MQSILDNDSAAIRLALNVWDIKPARHSPTLVCVDLLAAGRYMVLSSNPSLTFSILRHHQHMIGPSVDEG